MQNRFNEKEARIFEKNYSRIPVDLAYRIYTSRLIGREPDLVLHGGGNTSVKVKVRDIFGEDRDVLFVKGSGWDLSIIEPQGFACLDLERLRKFRHIKALSSEDMENQMTVSKTDAGTPDPSVEALVHGFLPHKYVDHTHADSILALTSQKNGSVFVKEVLGEKVGVIPYMMSGLPLAAGVLELFENDSTLEAIVILNHGMFTFGDDAVTSYERMIAYVTKAEDFIHKQLKTSPIQSRRSGTAENTAGIATLTQVIRGACSHRDKHGRRVRFYTDVRTGPDLVAASQSPDIGHICRTGAVTPDHVIRTKNTYACLEQIPEKDDDLKNMVAACVDNYKKEYAQYFNRQVERLASPPEMLDPYPRVFLVKGIGLVALGTTRKAAMVAGDIAEHTLSVKLWAEAMGTYTSVSEDHIFDMEYWALQQKKLKTGAPPPLQGQVAVVTGAGGAIGFGIADRLLAAGAVVVISDIDEFRLQKVRDILAARYHESRVISDVFDVTDLYSVEQAVTRISRVAGGIDILVPNAGIAHVAKIEDLSPDKFRQVTEVNLMGTFNVIKAAIPVFRKQGTGGNIVLISSKNVFDPGAAFGAYSASKAGAHQISKIAALELAEMGVRVNMVNPDAVFGDESVSSKLWDLIGPDRMRSRGLDPEGLKAYYRDRNLLKVSVLAEHVGNAVVFFASDLVPATGATLPVDGGVAAAFPR